VHGRPTHRRVLTVAFILTAAYCVAEVVGGWLTNSLALLSDAGHMFADVGALGLSLFAMRLARRPPTAEKTFGYQRVEILAAFVNGLLLWLVVGLLFREAFGRLVDPPPVHGAGVIAVAAVGLAVNLVSLYLLHGAHAESLNIRGAFAHVAGDALGSVGAIVAGVLVLAFGWTLADPLVSIGIGVLILFTSWGIVRESVDILMQGTPRDLSLAEIEQALLAIEGVCQVHDLHVWTQNSGLYLLSAHLVVSGPADARRIVETAQGLLREQFAIGHSTVQLDHESECTEDFRAH
jgi:cobalt-zinc-cadmium efflux system protein